MLLISGVGTGLAFTWWELDFLAMSADELSAYDDGLTRFNHKTWFPFGQQSMSEELVLVAIDDSTFEHVAAHPPWRDRYGSWPYDRVMWHDVIEYLAKVKAR